MQLGLTLFGHWFDNSVVVSAGALLISLLAYMRTIAAKPTLIVTVMRHLTDKDQKKLVGDLVVVYNAGRKGTLITNAGMRIDGTDLASAKGEVAGVKEEDAALPKKLDPGEVVIFPFAAVFGQYEHFRDEKGYSITFLVPRGPFQWKRTKTIRRKFEG